ncbi:DNA-protecting protein DprA [Pukyongia salina]|uniref:DNA-protecting protein DprA n=1 Tax=Pukyongia salina TaxID=2094025 RepID=A0A2S0HVL5_9FLAO|nr:DNA-processing protein DprA [Pukyongia salina]AVI50658.1 DNA-protecting protein DprA [Pukyongia salina]
MLSQNELRYLLALKQVPYLGETSVKKLIQTVGSAEGIFLEKKETLELIPGIGAYKLREFHPKIALDEADNELQFISEKNIKCLYFQEEDYPALLKHCVDGPVLLFLEGELNLKNKHIISVVGTRIATSHGKATCEAIISELAPLNPVIVSGFAYGIDIVAHNTAVAHGLQTIACLAHGLDQIYPKVHKKYVPAILENGGLLTEFSSNDPFDRKNFLRRNRIIAGMSEATVVIESAAKGGSLVTADIANSYNREVFAVPGRPGDLLSEGCNNLIKTQQAQLITSAADLVYNMGWNLDNRVTKPIQTALFPTLSEDETLVFNFLKTRDKELLDSIAISCQIPTHKTATVLLNLELKGLVQPLPGKLFQRV